MTKNKPGMPKAKQTQHTTGENMKQKNI